MSTRQTRIPGSDADRHKDLDDLGARYAEARDARMQLLAEEVELKEELHQMMKRYELTEYRIIDSTPNLLVTIETVEETVKVKKLEAPGEKKSRKKKGDAEVTVEG
jgi:hypothetical protein